MKKISILGLLIGLLLPQVALASFTDITTSHEYYNPIAYIKEHGGISRSADGLFHPDEEITKAAFIKMLIGNSGYEPTEDDKHGDYFDDIEGDEWYAPYVNAAVDLGILDTRTSNFNPGAPVRKGEASKLLVKSTGTTVPLYITETDWDFPYTDVIPGNLLATYIKKAAESEIVAADNNNFFGVYKKITRGYAAELIYEADLYSERDEFTYYLGIQDDNSVPLVDVLEDVYLRLVDDYYQGELSEDELLYTAISEMVDSVGDEYTVFAEPVEAVSLTQTLSGEYEGIGTYLTQDEDGAIWITAFLANSPAEEAGLKANDIIIKIGGEEISSFSLDDVATLIKGDAGTTVDLTVQRSTDDIVEILDYTVERRIMELTYIDTEILDNGIAYYRITFFGDDTDEKFATMTEEMLAEGFEGVLIDLRNNPGGYVDTAINILSHFIPEDELLVTLDYNDIDYDYHSVGPSTLNEYPVVVLVDQISASSSEIVAAVLQESGLATIVGETTMGKGSVQEVIYYGDGSSFKITVAHWLTPEGNDTNGIGVIPDVEVDLDMQAIDEGRDTQLEEAIDTLLEMMD